MVAVRTALGGWPVELADTAGLRATIDAIENLGIDRARRELGAADLVLLVLDRSESLQPIDRELMATLGNSLLVANKSDLPPAWIADESDLLEAPVVTVSAERGEGMERLIASIVERLVPLPPAPGEAVPFRAGQLEKLTRARDQLLAGNTAQAADELEFLFRRNAAIDG